MSKEQRLLRNFIAFLKSKNIYSKYINYLTSERSRLWRRNNVPPLPFIVSEIQKKNGIDLIAEAFLWSATKEGRNFWDEIHQAWRLKCQIK